MHDHAGVTHRVIAAVLLIGLLGWAFVLGERERRNRDGRGDDGVEAGDTGTGTGGGERVAAVRRVADGDSFVAVLDDGTDGAGAEVEVRLIGINAPERGECLADRARQVLAERLGSGPLTLERDVTDRDRYDRLLRYAVARGRLVEIDLVAHGLALATSTPPDTARQPEIDAAQVGARVAGLGIWNPGACGPAASLALQIVHVQADPPGRDDDNLNDEEAVVRNTGPMPVDMTGWRLRDDSSANRFAFPDGYVLGPGAEVAVHVGPGDDTATDLHWGHRSPVWDNDRDLALLLDPSGNTVSAFDVLSP